MRIRTFGAAAIFCLAIPAFASAQQNEPVSMLPDIPNAEGEFASNVMHELKSTQMMVPGVDVTFGDLQKMAVYGLNGIKVGNVNKVLGDSANTVKAVSVEVGGFLGLGGREVVIPLEKLKKGNEMDRLVTAMSKAEIEALEVWSNGRRSEPVDKSPSRLP